MNENVCVPDVGEATEIEVIEILVGEGAVIDKDQSLVVLESDKASMELPSPVSGRVTSIAVALGDKVNEGDLVLTLELAEDIAAVTEEPNEAANAIDATPEQEQEQEQEDQPVLQNSASIETGSSLKDQTSSDLPKRETTTGSLAHAGPGVRKQAREMGIDLDDVKPTGQNGRVLSEDLISHVKARMQMPVTTHQNKVVDHAKYGSIERLPLSRIRQASARNLHQSWTSIPHVTQFEEADISELEAFRRSQNERLKRSVDAQADAPPPVKFTLLPFIISCIASNLKEFPRFNASLDAGGEYLIVKNYINVGIAVETDEGLMVPVVRDADKIGLTDLSVQCGTLASAARNHSLPLDATQGGTFTITSLGGIGGTAFTPIINSPQVAILGVSRASIKPVFDGQNFQPATILPLSLSYDHRVIDGAQAARFVSRLAELLADIRQNLL